MGEGKIARKALKMGWELNFAKKKKVREVLSTAIKIDPQQPYNT